MSSEEFSKQLTIPTTSDLCTVQYCSVLGIGSRGEYFLKAYISVYAMVFIFIFIAFLSKNQSLPASMKLLTHFENPFSNPLQISKTTILTLKCRF
jgi:hypothetical protein